MKHFLFYPGYLPTQGIMPKSQIPLILAKRIEQLTRYGLVLEAIKLHRKRPRLIRLEHDEKPADSE